jgi:ferrochelatase
VPWLGPAVCDHLTSLAAAGTPGVVVIPAGFICDHLEVVYDLDLQAAKLARGLGLPMARAATPGTDPRFVSMITELVTERRSQPASVRALGSMGAGPDLCRDECCPRPVRTAGRPGAGA